MEASIELIESWDKINTELEIGHDADQMVHCLNMITFLKNQNHGAESIACWLQLHCQVMRFVPDLVEKLIEHKICEA